MIVTLMKLGKNNVPKYYTLHDRQALLTSPFALTVSWRVGDGVEHEKVYGFETIAEMDKKIRQIFSRKIREGFTLLYSFVRQKPEIAEDTESNSCLSQGAGYFRY